MSAGSPTLRVISVAALAAVLSGCVSLLPKQPPVQLYQFGAAPAAPAGPGAAGRGQGDISVVLAQVGFQRAAQGDGVLTIRGDEAAYIAGARWVTPAVLMFQEDAERAFADQALCVRLIGRSEAAAASALLRLEVTEFDVRYGAPGDAPRVTLSLRAILSAADGHRLMQKRFAVSHPATEDRVSAIVAAYDEAVGVALRDVVTWTDTGAPALVAAADPAAPMPMLPPQAVKRLATDPRR